MAETTSLALLLGNVRNATAYRYGAMDSLGNRMDTAKVIHSPADGFLAVYHSGRVCHLASSGDLMTWTHRAVIDEPATQPTIAMALDAAVVRAAAAVGERIGGNIGDRDHVGYLDRAYDLVEAQGREGDFASWR